MCALCRFLPPTVRRPIVSTRHVRCFHTSDSSISRIRNSCCCRELRSSRSHTQSTHTYMHTQSTAHTAHTHTHTHAHTLTLTHTYTHTYTHTQTHTDTHTHTHTHTHIVPSPPRVHEGQWFDQSYMSRVEALSPYQDACPLFVGLGHMAALGAPAVCPSSVTSCAARDVMMRDNISSISITSLGAVSDVL